MKKTAFTGAAYQADLDFTRLSGQIKRVKDCMMDQKWRTLDAIHRETGDPHASISAQLRNLRKTQFGSWIVDKRRTGDRSSGLFQYRLRKAVI